MRAAHVPQLANARFVYLHHAEPALGRASPALGLGCNGLKSLCMRVLARGLAFVFAPIKAVQSAGAFFATSIAATLRWLG